MFVRHNASLRDTLRKAKNLTTNAEVAEWSNAHDSKSCYVGIRTEVRILSSAPNSGTTIMSFRCLLQSLGRTSVEGSPAYQKQYSPFCAKMLPLLLMMPADVIVADYTKHASFIKTRFCKRKLFPFFIVMAHNTI